MAGQSKHVSRRTVLATAAAAPLMAAACDVGQRAQPSAAIAPQGKVLVWGWGDFPSNWDHDFARQMLREFEGLNPRLTVEPLNVQAGGNAGDEKFLVAAAGGEGPDVFSTGRSAVAEWGINGVIKALDDRMKASRVVRPEVFLPKLIDEGSWGGKVYSLSHTIDGRALFWDKEAYATAGLNPERGPETWDEFATAIQKTIKLEGGSLQVMGYHLTQNAGVGGHFWQTWLWELGGKFVSDDGWKVTFNSEAGIKALEWMVRLANAQSGWPAVTELYNSLVQSTPTRPSGWLLGIRKATHDVGVGGMVKTLNDDYKSVRFGVGHIPKGPTGTRATVRGGFQFVLASNARNPDGGWRFLEYQLGKDALVKWTDQWNRVPATKDASSSPAYLKNDPLRRLFVDVAAYGQRIPAIVPGYAEILTLNGQIANRVLTGQMSPREALSDAERTIQAELDKWKGR